jgi:cytochrome c biogenesis protein CcdA/thiol-disulfide isomerase/thioredoxin
VIVLLGIALLAGVITAVSPCVLPVLPIVLAGGASGGTRRPLAIVAGLVLSFTIFTLSAAALLDALGLPDDFLRNAAIALLFVLAATLLVPRLGMLLERPFAFLTRRRGGDLGGGFLLGVSLGLVFVPCAGPVLATITVLAAERRVGADAVLLTLAYALGAGAVLLAIAYGGQRASQRIRANAVTLRRVAGVVLAASAVAVAFNLDTTLQTRLGSYTSALQRHIEDTSYARNHLASLRGISTRRVATKATRTAKLPDYGAAPDFLGISDWINSRPLSITDLRGKVVLVDFWTYSCINCLRTIPHLQAWYAAYHRDGLDIVGVHTPEFAFEHVPSNVRRATHDLGVTWPVALDNNYATWDAYQNEYWPAEYLLDRNGHLRHVQFGEGDYGGTEQAIRTLLAAGGAAPTTHADPLADTTPTNVITPETYLGAARLDPSRYHGPTPTVGRQVDLTFPRTLAQNGLAYAGTWTFQPQYAHAGPGARIKLHFHARDVYVVLAGSGRVQELVDGRHLGTIDVNDARLYTAFTAPQLDDGTLELRFPAGVRAYSFTFG